MFADYINPSALFCAADWEYPGDVNESILQTLAKVAVTLAGFSGLVVTIRFRGTHAWSSTELRFLWLLIGDSFLVLFFSLLPFPMALAGWSQTTVWSSCSALLGSWFIVGNLLALRGERRDRAAQRLVTVPVITPVLYSMFVIAMLMGIALWLSAWNLFVPRGQAVYVFGLLVLLAFAVVEFLFFIGLTVKQDRNE